MSVEGPERFTGGCLCGSVCIVASGPLPRLPKASRRSLSCLCDLPAGCRNDVSVRRDAYAKSAGADRFRQPASIVRSRNLFAARSAHTSLRALVRVEQGGDADPPPGGEDHLEQLDGRRRYRCRRSCTRASWGRGRHLDELRLRGGTRGRLCCLTVESPPPPGERVGVDAELARELLRGQPALGEPPNALDPDLTWLCFNAAGQYARRAARSSRDPLNGYRSTV